MSDFADVEQFAREHTACGGLVPQASSPASGGGYHLSITCACGATHDRWVTAEEASHPLPRPSAGAPPVAPPRSWPARPPTPPPPPRIEVVQPAHRTSRGRAVWLVLVLLLVVGGAATVYVTGADQLTSLTDLGRRAPPPRVPPLPPAATVPIPVPRPTRAEVVTALRDLQDGITPSVSLNEYASRVAFTRVTVEGLESGLAEPVRDQARDILEIHRLAAAAWRARTVDDRDEWTRLASDPAVELCPPVRRAVDAAPASRAPARGAAVAASLLQLWQCAAEKLASLDQAAGGG
jgi:hypothetical protein